MMVPKLSETSKIAFLSVGVVVVFGNIAWRLVHTDGASAAAPPPTAAAPAPASSAETVATTAPAEPVAISDSDAPPAVDIFRRVLPDAGAAAAKPAPPVRPAAPSPAVSPASFAPMPVAHLDGRLPDGPLPLPTAGPANSPVAPAVAELPPIRLTGILSGDSPVAILEIGGKPHVFRIGQTVDGVRLAALRGRSATVKRGAETFNLELGAK